MIIRWLLFLIIRIGICNLLDGKKSFTWGLQTEHINTVEFLSQE